MVPQFSLNFSQLVTAYKSTAALTPGVPAPGSAILDLIRDLDKLCQSQQFMLQGKDLTLKHGQRNPSHGQQTEKHTGSHKNRQP